MIAAMQLLNYPHHNIYFQQFKGAQAPFILYIMSKKSLPHYIEVFEKRINKQKERIKNELEKDKKHRNRNLLKYLLEEIKNIRKTVKAVKEEHAVRCPHMWA